MSNNMQIDVDFVNFIAKEVKTVKSPMNLSELCKEFKKKTGISHKIKNLVSRLNRIRDKMSEMEHIDTEAKVKMMYALSSPVSNGLLMELKKQADVELDEQHRIIKYKQYETDFQLSGVHVARPCDTEKEKEMLKFLVEKSENTTSPITDKAFLKEFIVLGVNLKAEHSLYMRYNLLKQQIYLAPEYDQETKIRMIFVSNTKIHANILDELRQNAVVEVDEYHRITKYEANNGSLKLEGNRKKLGISLKSTTEWSKEEREKLLSFIAEKSKQTKVPLSIYSLCREFAENNGVSRTINAVERHLQRNLPNISELCDFDMETRMRMLFALSVPVDEGFLRELRKKAAVEVDEHKRITKYKANDESLELETKRLPPLTIWSKEETEKLEMFIAEKSKQTNEPLNIKALSREFAENHDNSRTKDAVLINIRKNFRPKISKLDSVDMQTKVRMIFALSVSVDEEFLNEIRKKAIVEIDEKRRITKYKANDESLQLKGDHSLSAKTKKAYAQKISKRINLKASETDDETEDYDNEEDKEGRENNENGEQEEIETNSSIRKSGRISKKPYPDNDFTCDFVGFTLNSPTKARDSKIEKEKEKLVEMPSDSSSEAPLVKNLKRKIIQCPSDDTIPFSKTQKLGKVASTRNETESDKIDSERKQCDGEFKYNATGESLPHKEVKMEDEEYKPDLSFLCGTIQDAAQIFSGTKENRFEYVDQSSENTEEMTSGKQFMELLHGMVDSLDSPILVELESKIEEAIEKFRNEDHKILLNDIVNALNTGLIILNKNATIQSPTGEFTSLRDFLLILRSTLSTFQSSSLSNFQLKLKENIKKLDIQDKMIPVENIRTVLETVLLLAMP